MQVLVTLSCFFVLLVSLYGNTFCMSKLCTNCIQLSCPPSPPNLKCKTSRIVKVFGINFLVPRWKCQKLSKDLVKLAKLSKISDPWKSYHRANT